MTKLIIVGAPGAATLPPPFISDLQHWWDFTDASQVFQDVGGITPSGDTDPILRVNNKGYDGQPLIDSESDLTYTEDLLPGINVGSNAGLLPLITVLNNELSTDGITVVLIVNSEDGVTSNPLKWEFSGDVSQIQADIDGSGNWEVQFDLADEKDTFKSVVTDELLSVYGAIKGGSIDYKASGAPLQSGSSGYPVTSAGLTITVGDLTGDIAEVLIYDFKLNVPQQAALEQRNSTKYDGLPHAIVPPPPVLLPPFLPNLTHWWDFTDPTQVFQDIAGLTPSVDGTILQRVNDKGIAGDDLQDAASGITWHTGVVNGLSVTRNTVVQVPSRFTSQALATLIGGVGGFTYSAVQRLFSVPGGLGIVHAIDNGPSNVSHETGFGNWSEDHPNQGTTFSNKAIVVNEWVEHTVSDGGPSGYIQHVSGAADVTAGANFAIQAGTPVEIFAQGVDGEAGEILVYDRGLTALELLTLQAYYDTKYGVLPFVPAATPYDALISASNPIAYYKLDETVGLVMADSSGNANDGDYTGTVTLGQAQVVNDGGNSALFSGVAGSFANIMPGMMDLFSSVSPKSLECWINTSDTVGPIMVGRGPSGTPVIGIYMGNDGLQSGNGQIFVFMRDNLSLGISTLASPLTYNDGSDHHIVVTMDAAKNYILYVDGVAVHTSTHILTVGITTNDPQLGEDAISTGGAPHGSFAGRIDNAAIYDVALSAGTVLAHYNQGL